MARMEELTTMLHSQDFVVEAITAGPHNQ